MGEWREGFSHHRQSSLMAFQIVHSVGRRDAEDRTLSELVKFQESLERLGLLWTPLDGLHRDQALELVRNLHVSIVVSGQVGTRARCHTTNRRAIDDAPPPASS